MSDTDPEDYPPPTAPRELSITIGGLVDPEKAREFGQVLAGYITSISSFIDVERLDAVTATDDYTNALAAVDRGFDTSRVLKPSENTEMLGIAMCAQVLREGVPKVHLFLDIEHVLPLWIYETGSPEHSTALQLLAHECAHIEDLKRQDEAYPGVILQRSLSGWISTTLAPIAYGLWNEYYACRRSAMFRPAATADFASVVVACLDNNQSEVDGAIRKYRTHADLDRLVAETIDPATRALRAAAYLFGHIDGIDAWDTIPDVESRIEGHRLSAVLKAMISELQRLWDIRNDWAALEDMDGLVEIVTEAFGVAGVIVTPEEDGGAYLHVPFTSGTI